MKYFFLALAIITLVIFTTVFFSVTIASTLSNTELTKMLSGKNE